MKNYELLNMIGDVNEDYVLAAGSNVARPRFGWKKLAAWAACAALIAAAYPVYRAFHPALHSYTTLEGGGAPAALDEVKAPAGGAIEAPGQDALDAAGGGRTEAVADPQSAPEDSTVSSEGHVDGEVGSDIGGEDHLAPVLDLPVDEEAASQYDGLLRGMGMQVEGAASYPDWFAGAWIDHGGSPTTPAWLTVAIVDGFRTPGLEAQIEGWCGSGVVFRDAKYSHAYLDNLMDPVTQALDGTGLACGIGVDVVENCLGVDLYSDGAAVPNGVLARLAALDPDGDAIRVRVITQGMSTLTDEVVKGPASDTRAFDGAWAEQPAHYDLLPHGE